MRRVHDRPTARCRVVSRLILLAVTAMSMVTSHADAQNAGDQRIPITGDRISGFVLPVQPQVGDIRIESLRATAWTVDDTKRLVLRDDVLLRIGNYQIEADAACVWINRIPSRAGVITQIAAYFSNVRNSSNRAGIGVFGREVLLTGSALGEVKLNTSALDNRRITSTRLVQDGERRLAAYLQRLEPGVTELNGYPATEKPGTRRFVPVPGGDPSPQQNFEGAMTLPPLEAPLPQLIEPSGTVRFAAGIIEVEPGDEENTITCSGGLIIDYLGRDPELEWSRLTLTAERAVIFTDPGSITDMARREFSAEQVRGIYLEGNVSVIADDGRYAVRAPQVYYDFQTGQATMVGAVLRTYSRELARPVYARADELRQISANQWEATGVRVSTSEFAVPHIALGSEQVLITQEPGEDTGDDETFITARGNTLRFGGTPVFYWPAVRGTLQRPVLKSLAIGSANNEGIAIETRWDLYTLLGRPPVEGLDLDLKLDGFTSRGMGAGVEGEYTLPDNGAGRFEIYGQFDEGTDRTSSGLDVVEANDFRGVALWEHRSKLSRYWTVQGQFSLISDPTYITTWRPEEFRTRRPYETSLYLKHQKDNAAFTGLLSYNINDFISTSDLLSSRAYSVERLPEFGYHRFGDSLFGDSATYSGSMAVSRLRITLHDRTPAQYGVPGAAFGLGPNASIGAALQGTGIMQDYVTRFDTRHEIAVPLEFGPVNVTPFLVGRFTGYDDDFQSFSSDADEFRFFGSAGVRLATELQRVDNSAESVLFDLHRMRHIIEPSVTLWYAHATVDQTDLPVYDETVESIATGSAVRFGLHNTWQTQRGGPGYWRTVDVFTLDADVVLTSGDTDRESPIAQFFDFRPEYSHLGDHVAARGSWQVSDSLLLISQGTYDLDESTIARGSMGALLTHSPAFETFVEFRYIDAADARLLGAGWRYKLSPVYHVAIRPEWDFAADEFRLLTLQMTRTFPDFDLIVRVEHDEIEDETTVGASIDVASF